MFKLHAANKAASGDKDGTPEKSAAASPSKKATSDAKPRANKKGMARPAKKTNGKLRTTTEKSPMDEFVVSNGDSSMVDEEPPHKKIKGEDDDSA